MNKREKLKFIKLTIIAAAMAVVMIGIVVFGKAEETRYMSVVPTLLKIVLGILLVMGMYFLTRTPLYKKYRKKCFYSTSACLYMSIMILGIVELANLFQIFQHSKFPIEKIWGLVIFPCVLSAIISSAQEEKLKKDTARNSIVSFCFILCSELILFSDVWRFNLKEIAILNIAAVVFSIFKYAPSGTKRIKCVLLSGAYAVVRSGMFVCQRMILGHPETAWLEAGYAKAVSELMEKVALLGTSDAALQSERIQWLFEMEASPLHYVLAYCGWIGLFCVLVVYLGFGKIIFEMFGMKNIDKEKYVIYGVCVVSFLVSILFGTIYSLGMPYYFSLPFENTMGDVITLLLLMFSAYENVKKSGKRK